MKKRLWGDNCILRDKYIFSCLCEHHELPVPRIFGINRNGFVKIHENDLWHSLTKKNIKRLVLKPVEGMQGKGILVVNRENIKDLSKILNQDNKKDYIIQEYIEQHLGMNRINPYSLNTVRIATILSPNGKVELLAAMLRTSATKSSLDNFSLGGIVIGIDINSGKLKKEGIIGIPNGKVITKHPLTKTEFRNFEIPFWQEVKELSKKAQKIFYPVKSIGWDIAITKDMPILIEGNHEWSHYGIQAVNGGLLTAKNRNLFAQYGISFYG
jgi:hypothetical protein